MPESNQTIEGWKASTIGEHISFEGGTQPPRSTFIFEEDPGYIRLIQTRDFKSDQHITFIPVTANHKTFTEADVMIGRYGPPVFQIYRGLSGAYNVALIKAFPKSTNLRNDYLYYILKQDKLFNLIDSLSRRSSGQTGVDMNALKSFPLSLPPLKEQDRIVEVLRTWDEAIEVASEETKAQEKLQHALTDQLVFGSLRLPLFGQKNPKEKMRWFSLPVDWSTKSVGELSYEISEKNTTSISAEVLSCSKHKGFVRSSDYFKKKVYSDDLSGYKRIYKGDFGFPSNHLEEGSIGLQGLADVGLVSPIYTVFRFNQKEVDNRYAFRVLKTAVYRHIFKVNTNSSVDRRGSLRWTEFSKIPFPLPTIEEQRAICETLDTQAELVSKLRRRYELLMRQKRGLMQKLLTGEWRANNEDPAND